MMKAEDTGIPDQSLINLYLRDCVAAGRQPDLAWHPSRNKLMRRTSVPLAACRSVKRRY